MRATYAVETVLDNLGQINHFKVVATGKGKLPRDNFFNEIATAQRWIDERLILDKRNERSRGRAEALRSVGMVRTRYGWE